MRQIFLILILLLPLGAIGKDCPGHDLSAFRMSTVYRDGEGVKPFLLTPSGQEYIPCSGVTPKVPKNNPDNLTVGIRLRDGTIQQVNYFELVENSKNEKKNIITLGPLPHGYNTENQCHGDSDHYITSQAEEIANLAGGLDNASKAKQDTLKMIYEFNRDMNICSRVNESGARLPTLLNAWKDFCSNKNPEVCQKAKEVDLLSRTVAFEAHELGKLDGVPDEEIAAAGYDDLTSKSFPKAQCERRFIAMTLRNRGMAGRGSAQIPTIGETPGQEARDLRPKLSAHSGLFTDGLHSPTYNIWKDDFQRTSSITACFSRGTVLPENATELEKQRHKIFQEAYLRSLRDTYDVVFQPELADSTVRFLNDKGEEKDIQKRITHYYHPLGGMRKCFFQDQLEEGWEVMQNSRGIVASREVTLPDGQIVSDYTLLKNEPYRYNKETGEIQFVERVVAEDGKHYHDWSGNVSPDAPKWKKELTNNTNGKREYGIVVKYSSRHVDGSHVRSNPQKNWKNNYYFCESQGGERPIGTEAPGWALDKTKKPSVYSVQCDLPDGSTATIGGNDNPLVMPVLTREN